jgi:glycosyltransferase involved in cell wall biosynthesis
MKSAVQKCLGADVYVSVLPFTPSVDSFAPKKISASVRKYDFVYVASGEAHKNHNNLLEAWHLLANAGLKPSLALTINSQSFPLLSAEITRYTQKYGLNIVNLNQMTVIEITNLYQSSSALIFPSTTESLGLPLIEATQLGLPVLASELDYVRDVIQPAETFDPNSPVSIARAVRRFLGNVEPTVQIRSADEFLAEVLK